MAASEWSLCCMQLQFRGISRMLSGGRSTWFAPVARLLVTAALFLDGSAVRGSLQLANRGKVVLTFRDRQSEITANVPLSAFVQSDALRSFWCARSEPLQNIIGGQRTATCVKPGREGRLVSAGFSCFAKLSRHSNLFNHARVPYACGKT